MHMFANECVTNLCVFLWCNIHTVKNVWVILVSCAVGTKYSEHITLKMIISIGGARVQIVINISVYWIRSLVLQAHHEDIPNPHSA